MHYYQHDIGDYARDTSHLSALEHGIYRLLLDWCYLNEKPLTTELALRIGRGNPVETQSVLSGFFSQENEGWVHKRVQKEIAAYRLKAEKNRQNGLKGGRKTQKEPNANQVGSQSGSEIEGNLLTYKPINLDLEANASVGATDEKEESEKTRLKTPYAKIMATYNEKLPELPQATLLGSARKKAMRGWWQWAMTSTRADGSRRAQTHEQGLEFCSAYFERVRRNDFLMGRARRGETHENWQCDIDFLLGENGRKHVVEKTQ